MSRQVTDRKTTSFPKKHSRFALRTNLVSCRPVQNVATPHKFTEAAPLSRERFPLAFVLSVLFLGALWFGLCRELSGEWSVNEQYNFGWFVPFFALCLFWLRWQDRPEIRSQKSEVRSRTLIASAIAIVSLFLLLPVRLFEIANPEWRLLAWVHAAAVMTLTLLLIWYAGGMPWLRHFAFPVVFIFIAVPWPTQLEVPIIQGLMRIVAHVAAETAMLLGTPAKVEGNLIRVSNGLVGVNEACSGIRSLQTSLMISLLFGEVKRFSVLRRLILVVCAVVIALLANFLRAVFLVRIAATENLSEVGRWHDVAGYSIVAFVFVATLGVAYLLGRSQARDRTSEIRIQNPQSAIGNWQLAIPVSYIAIALCWLSFVEIGSAAWYRLHERNLFSGIHWNVQWPDVCLPASGWTQVADDGVRNYPVTGVFELPFRHFEFRRSSENSAPQTAHAFYCLSEDRAVASSAPLPTSLPSMTGSRSEWTRAERISTVLEGRRHLGQQVIQAIFISSYPFSGADAESQLRDLIREVVVLREPEK